ncbi:hypothetical protein AB9E34_06660 [Rhizobium leguminosarum]
MNVCQIGHGADIKDCGQSYHVFIVSWAIYLAFASVIFGNIIYFPRGCDVTEGADRIFENIYERTFCAPVGRYKVTLSVVSQAYAQVHRRDAFNTELFINHRFSRPPRHFHPGDNPLRVTVQANSAFAR